MLGSGQFEIEISDYFVYAQTVLGEKPPVPSSLVYRKKENTIWHELVYIYIYIYIYLNNGKPEFQVFSTDALHLQVEGNIISVSPVLLFKSF